MTGRYFTQIAFLLFLILQGCHEFSNFNLWNNLYPTSKRFYSSIKKIERYCSDRSNRKRAINELRIELDSLFLSKKKAIKLALFVDIIISKTKDDIERQEIFEIILLRKRHRNFLGNFFLTEYGTAPPFIKLAIKTLLDDLNFSVYLFDPDGGLLEREYISEFYAQDLRKATGKNFGQDFQKWKNWWETEGKYLKYDWGKKIYLYTDEDCEKSDKTIGKSKANQIYKKDNDKKKLFNKLGYLD